MNAYETNAWHNPKSYAPDCGELLAESWAIAASRHRAADASHSSLLRVSTIGGIAIAVLCIIYFAAEFLR